MEESAKKHDFGKIDLSLVPKIAVVKLAEAMTVGLKYGRYNYCGGMESSRIMGALLRHAFSWFDGEDFDPEGQHHLGSVMACCAMILRQEELGTLKDNRYVPKQAVEAASASPAPTTAQVVPTKVYQVVCESKNSKAKIILATYQWRDVAALMIREFFRPQWPQASYDILIQEIEANE